MTNQEHIEFQSTDDNCIMPEMPYCPDCPHGLILYPEWVETYEDTLDFSCEWICLLKESEKPNELAT